jgi:hypothetical protein
MGRFCYPASLYSSAHKSKEKSFGFKYFFNHFDENENATPFFEKGRVFAWLIFDF